MNQTVNAHEVAGVQLRKMADKAFIERRISGNPSIVIEAKFESKGVRYSVLVRTTRTDIRGYFNSYSKALAAFKKLNDTVAEGIK